MQVYGMQPNQGWVSLSSRVVVLILQSKLDLPEVVKVLTSNISQSLFVWLLVL
jgi:branched-subunit amino acid transport protein